ncbi:unnamed protein product [Candidula unifasciata]|uniref:Large ribosomal subunit protein bL35m n=1 Tax=Candidula unifasciata TaxID=100452 RepID=A0A8S3Z1H2_9EUPU|nr:unnamed protein product [Candidula unifasciata]
MAASLVKSLSKLCINAPKANLLPNSPWLKGTSSFQFSTLRNQTTLLKKNQSLLPAMKTGSALDHRSLLHTTSVCASTYERKLWREPRVIDRFYRLHWGAWIRTRGGRKKKLYKKTAKHRAYLQQHIFCTAGQSIKLSRLVTEHWKEPKYFVDTPYDPYHKRTNCSFFPNYPKFYP